jgi:hypothetical protein
MRAWHQAQGSDRHKVIIPDSAHGTNPASVTLGGYEVVTVPERRARLRRHGALAAVLDEDVAGIMLTNPNTLGLFEEDIAAIAAAVHGVGGLLYYDGANLNAILGVVRPGDMGFDIVHMNLHKTFATPHGGGGPGCRSGSRVRAAGPRSSPDPSRAVRSSRTTRSPVYEWATHPSRSAGCTPGTATPWCWPGPSPTSWPTGETASAHRRDRRAQRQLDPSAVDRHLRRALRPAVHARGRPVGTQHQAGPRGPGPRRGQAAARGGIPLADRVLPAHRGRGPDDRAHRDREPPDPRGLGRVAGADRLRGRHRRDGTG